MVLTGETFRFHFYLFICYTKRWFLFLVSFQAPGTARLRSGAPPVACDSPRWRSLQASVSRKSSQNRLSDLSVQDVLKGLKGLKEKLKEFYLILFKDDFGLFAFYVYFENESRRVTRTWWRAWIFPPAGRWLRRPLPMALRGSGWAKQWKQRASFMRPCLLASVSKSIEAVRYVKTSHSLINIIERTSPGCRRPRRNEKG